MMILSRYMKEAELTVTEDPTKQTDDSRGPDTGWENQRAIYAGKVDYWNAKQVS